MYKFIQGDATKPIGAGTKIIVHICNDIGGWGKGFVLALSKKWIAPEREYLEWYQSQKDFSLGKVQFIKVKEDIFVANLIGQRDIFPKNNIPPIRYEAVEKGLENIAQKSKELNASIHMPRIGCGLAGGQWKEMEKIITKTLIEKGISVTVYDFH